MNFSSRDSREAPRWKKWCRYSYLLLSFVCRAFNDKSEEREFVEMDNDEAFKRNEQKAIARKTISQ